mmetsp:Transcript_18798/g.48205  ORF Transcript_18798/g.48205 Transcript_18798/m.48205 type:complete len:226 (-) Transcript_18798:830-1507(-)
MYPPARCRVQWVESQLTGNSHSGQPSSWAVRQPARKSVKVGCLDHHHLALFQEPFELDVGPGWFGASHIILHQRLVVPRRVAKEDEILLKLLPITVWLVRRWLGVRRTQEDLGVALSGIQNEHRHACYQVRWILGAHGHWQEVSERHGVFTQPLLVRCPLRMSCKDTGLYSSLEHQGHLVGLLGSHVGAQIGACKRQVEALVDQLSALLVPVLHPQVFGLQPNLR